MELISAYGCSFCGMSSRHKSSVKRHERRQCKKNPHRSRCGNCVHLYEDSETFYNRNHNGDPGSTDYEYPVFNCLKFEVDIDQGALNENNECGDWELLNNATPVN